MTALVMLMGLVVASVLQTELPAVTLMGQAKVPLLLCVVIYYALERNHLVMLLAGVAAGFLQDALSLVPLGYSSTCFCLCGWLMSLFRRLVLTDSWMTQIIFGLAGAMMVTLLQFLLLLQSGLVDLPFSTVILKVLGTAVFGGIAAPFVYAGLGVLDRTCGNVALTRDVEGPTGDYDVAAE
ncbi:MAG: rod shape-determining protein MreD [Verrucomicrobia bacterium]|nr:rod shape-determining protein MreD [Verrucomicrobiota bacterium]